MLVIRFLRAGKKNQPFFKIVVIDKKKPPRSGSFVEQVGFYNPLTKEKSLKKERIEYWLSQGVKPSDTVHNLLVNEKILKGPKIPKHKTKKKKEGLSEEPTKEPSKEELKEVSKEETPKQETLKEEISKEEESKEEKPTEKTQKEEKPNKESPEEGSEKKDEDAQNS